jgi:twitching motility two-component system response regulator PilH
MITHEDFNTRESNNASISAARTFKKQPCVLLAEDDRSLRRYLEVVLRRAGYLVVAAADGLEAMRVTLTAEVDIIVTDAIMPNLNGYELCRFVRNTPQLSHLPIVLLSALEQKESRPEDRQADAYLSKPISPEDLIACLDTLLLQPI